MLEKQGAAITGTYTYGNSLIRKDGETPLFDGGGSQRVVTNSSQSVTATSTLDAFGVSVASTGSSSSPYRFGATSGYRSDGDAGLSHVGARYYDAQVGRFITRDTYLDQKPYLYCEHDPINHLDPTGHWGITLSFSLFIVNVSVTVGSSGIHGGAGVGIGSFGPGVVWSPSDPSPGKWTTSIYFLVVEADRTGSEGSGGFGSPGWGVWRNYTFR